MTPGLIKLNDCSVSKLFYPASTNFVALPFQPGDFNKCIGMKARCLIRRVVGLPDQALAKDDVSDTTGIRRDCCSCRISLAREANEHIAELVRQNRVRFQGFATLPTSEPEAAARELDRAVRQLGLNGALVFGRTSNLNFDDRAFWPIFEAASALKAPPLHPPAIAFERGAEYLLLPGQINFRHCDRRGQCDLAPVVRTY